MITEINVSKFRSLDYLELTGLSSFFALTGRNGSGKSNVLRALNAFFNGEVEPNKPIDLGRDHHGEKRKKQIQVTVRFQLPDEFSFQKSVQATAQELGLLTRDFRIRRSWQYGGTGLVEQRFEIAVQGGSFTAIQQTQTSALELLLTRLIRFRYLPNHVHPLATVRNDAKRLQQVLLTKIRRSKGLKKKVDPEAQLQAMAAVADDLIAPVTAEIRQTDELDSVRIDPPTDWTQVALAMGVSLQGKGDERRDAELHGSGHQSLLAFTLLHLLDSQFSAAFGWHQANIWAIEEPESFLHHELCYRVAGLLRKYADSPRFQIIVITHSPIIMASVGGGTTLGSTSPKVSKGRELINNAMKTGASPFIHPLLLGEAKPLLIVEGRTDVQHLNTAYEVLGRTNPWEIRAVEEYGVASGVTGFDQLLRYHGSVIAARRSESPVVLLIDYEQKSGKVAELNNRLSVLHPRSAAIQWDQTATNPDIDLDSVTGIEAYLATAAFSDCAVKTGFTILMPPSKSVPISIKKTQTAEVKAKLAVFCSERKKAADYVMFGPGLDLAEAAAGLRKIISVV